jgi:hypothetical protein
MDNFQSEPTTLTRQSSNSSNGSSSAITKKPQTSATENIVALIEIIISFF